MIAYDPLAITEPNQLVYCDFETQSSVDLRKVGAKVYLTHPHTRIMLGVFLHKGTLHIWCPKKCQPKTGKVWPLPNWSVPSNVERSKWYDDNELPDAIRTLAKQYTLVAHNAELFDAWLWKEKVADCNATWLDTLHLCRAAGLPGKLDRVLQLVVGHGKEDDTAMKVLTSAKITSIGMPVYTVGTPALWHKLIKYGIGDVVDLEAVCNYLRATRVADHEAETIMLHTKINQRGFRIDREWLLKLRECWRNVQDDSKEIISELTEGVLHAGNIGSPKQVKDWLELKGFVLPGDSLNKTEVEKILAMPEKYIDGLSEDDGRRVLALLAERINAVRSTTGKLDRVLTEIDADECVRYWAVYHKAHPGRFAGRGVQPHNFPRGVKLKQEPSLLTLLEDRALQTATIYDSAKANKCRASDVLSTLTRSIIRPRKGKVLIPIDFASIEARGVAWFAECPGLLKVFNDPKGDAYCSMASKLYGRTITPKDELERFVGKTIVLGCGYQMWAPKFAMSCANFGIDLHKAGVTAEQCVLGYRKGYPEVPKLWQTYNNSVIAAVSSPGSEVYGGRCRFVYDDGWLIVWLPSGKQQRYRDARLTQYPHPYKRGEMQTCVDYTHPEGYTRSLYGGIITENIVQATARELLCDAMLRTDSEETPIVLHVHDEIVYEVDDRQAEQYLHQLGVAMSTPPTWAFDFPLGCEGFAAFAYTKGGLPTSIKGNYLKGKRY